MRKVLMILVVFMLLFTAAVFADDLVATGGGGGGCPGPNCTDVDAGGHIDAGQNQWQNNSHWRDGDTNFVSSSFNMSQYDWASGSGTDGFTGSVEMGQIQGRKFDTTVELGSGGKYTRFWGSGAQSDYKEGTLTERCDLNLSGDQHFNSSVYTDQANSTDHPFMAGNQYVNAGANVSLQGGKYGTGAEFDQSAVAGYEQGDKFENFQEGFVGMNTKLDIPARTAPPQD